MEKKILKKLYFHLEAKKLLNYEKRQCILFDANITCSKLDTDRLKRNVNDLFVTEIPNGVDCTYFNPQDERRISNRLIFAGGMKWYPNRRAMLFFAEKVWPLLKKKIPSISIDVIGISPPDVLLNLSRTDNSFHVHGFVDDVRPYLENAAIYVCPIDDGGGTKLKVLDALAMKLPLVANPIACEGIDVKDGETVLFATDPTEYVEKVSFLLANNSTAREIGERGRKLVNEKYSYKAIGKKLADLFVELSG
jgi:glycosyltransferase involved in cell wall biosynthesis